jgi:hypothetical protein
MKMNEKKNEVLELVKTVQQIEVEMILEILRENEIPHLDDELEKIDNKNEVSKQMVILKIDKLLETDEKNEKNKEKTDEQLLENQIEIVEIDELVDEMLHLEIEQHNEILKMDKTEQVEIRVVACLEVEHQEVPELMVVILDDETEIEIQVEVEIE